MTNQLNTSPEFHTVDINNFSRDLTKLLKRVKAGETFIITEYSNPIAEFQPLTAKDFVEIYGTVIEDADQKSIRGCSISSPEVPEITVESPGV